MVKAESVQSNGFSYKVFFDLKVPVPDDSFHDFFAFGIADEEDSFVEGFGLFRNFHLIMNL